MDVLSPVIPVLCHSDWLFHGESCMSMPWCCPSRQCVAFLACVHLALFLALSLSPLFPHGVTIICCQLALTVSNSFLFTPALLGTHSFVFFAVHEPAESFSVLSSHRRPDVFLHSFWESSFHSHTLLQATLALSLVVSRHASITATQSLQLRQRRRPTNYNVC